MRSEHMNQIVELSRQMAPALNDQLETRNITKILKKMNEKKDISKYFSFLSEIISQGINREDNQNHRAQTQLAMFVSHIISYEKSYPEQSRQNIFLNNTKEHFEGNKELSKLIQSYARYSLKFLMTQPPSDCIQTMMTLFVSVYLGDTPEFEIKDPQLYHPLQFKFQYQWGYQNQLINLQMKFIHIDYSNEKGLYILIRNIQLDQNLVDSLTDLAFRLIQTIQVENIIGVLFRILDQSRLSPSQNIVSLIETIAQNKQAKLQELLLKEPYFEKYINDDIKFPFIVDVFLRVQQEGDVSQMNAILERLEIVTRGVRPARQTDKIIQLISTVLNSQRLPQLQINHLSNITNTFHQKDPQSLPLSLQVFTMLRDFIKTNQSQQIRLFIFDLFDILYWNDEIEVLRSSIEIIRAQSMTSLMCQVISSLIYRCSIDRVKTIFQGELQRLLLETPYVNPYTLYLFQIVSMRVKDVSPPVKQFLQSIITKIEQKTVVLLFSLFQLVTHTNKRLQQKLAQLTHTDELSVWEICGALGYQASKRELVVGIMEKDDVLRMAEYLNENEKEIANFIANQNSSLRQLCLNGFYQIVINIVNAAVNINPKFKNSNFLRLFNIIQESMYVRNKNMNLNKLLVALKETQSLESQLKVYVLLLKVNYMFGPHRDLKSVLQNEPAAQELGSEFSSEFGGSEYMQDEGREECLRQELAQYIKNKIQNLISQYDESEKSSQLRLDRTLDMMQPSKNATGLSLETATEILKSLFGNHVTSLATMLIQVFSSENRIQNIRLLLVELFKLCKELKCEADHMNEYAYQFRNNDLAFLVRPLNDDEIQGAFQINTQDLQFDLLIRRNLLFWELPQQTQSLLVQKINEPNQQLAWLCATVLKCNLDLLPKETLTMINKLKGRVFPYQQITTTSLLQFFNQRGDMTTLYRVNSLILFQQLYKPQKDSNTNNPNTAIKKNRKKKKNSTSTLDIEPTTIYEYLKCNKIYQQLEDPDKLEQLNDQIRGVFWTEFKIIWESDSSLLQNLMMNIINDVYKKDRFPEQDFKQNIDRVLLFLEFFINIEDTSGQLFYSTLGLLQELLKEIRHIVPTQQNFENLSKICKHANSLIMLFYQNKSRINSQDLQKFINMFSEGYSTVIFLTDRIKTLPVEQCDLISESLSEILFTIMIFIKHLEIDGQPDFRPSQQNYQLLPLMNTINEFIKLPPIQIEQECSFKPNTNIRQHFFKCTNCPFSKKKEFLEICSTCALKCHMNHEKLEYDGIANGFCDCASGCQAKPKKNRPRTARRPRSPTRLAVAANIFSMLPEDFDQLNVREYHLIESERLLREYSPAQISDYQDEESDGSMSSQHEDQGSSEAPQALNKKSSDSIVSEEDEEEPPKREEALISDLIPRKYFMKKPQLPPHKGMESEIESLYPSELQSRSVVSSSLGNESMIGKSYLEIEEDLMQQDSITRLFTNKESIIHQITDECLQNFIIYYQIEEVQRILQNTLFYLCRQSILKYIDLSDLDGSLKNTIDLPSKRPKKIISKPNQKEKTEFRISNESQIFELSKYAENIELEPQQINQFIVDKHFLRTEPVENIEETKRHVQNFYNRQQIVGQPFLIRQLISVNSDGLIAVACGNKNTHAEVRIYDKTKLLRHVREERGSRGSQLYKENLMQFMRGSSPYMLGQIQVRFSIISICFNKKRPRELLVCGLCDIFLIMLKKDGQQDGPEKPLIMRQPQVISKVMWVPGSEVLFAYLAYSTVFIFNSEKKQVVSQFSHFEDDKFKDFTILQTTEQGEYVLLTLDNNCSVFQAGFSTKPMGKIMMMNKFNIPEYLKGSNKISFGIECVSNNLILISFKDGRSILCQLQETNRQFSIRSFTILDTVLKRSGVEVNLFSAPQTITQSRDAIFFTSLLCKQNAAYNGASLHIGQLAVCELRGKNLYFQILELDRSEYQFGRGSQTVGIVDSYVVLEEGKDSSAIVAIVDGRFAMFLVSRVGPVDWVQENNNVPQFGFIKQEERQPIQEEKQQLQRSLSKLRESFSKELIHDLNTLCPKPLIDFALRAPGTLDILINGQKGFQPFDLQGEFSLVFRVPQQQIGLTGFQLELQKAGVLEINILGARSLRIQTAQYVNVPFTILESFFSILNQEITCTISSISQIRIVSCQVFQQEFKFLNDKTQVQRLSDKVSSLVGVVETRTDQAIRSTLGFQFLDAHIRQEYLSSIITENGLINIILLDALDMVSISILNGNRQINLENQNVLQVVNTLQIIIKSNCRGGDDQDKLLVCTAKRLLKLILTAYKLNSDQGSRIIWGHEYDYKTICDSLFFEQIKEDLKEHIDISRLNKILRKLQTIAEKRFPQLFYLFARYPRTLKQLAQRICASENENNPLQQNCLQLIIKLYIYRYYFDFNIKSKSIFDEISQIISNSKLQRKFQSLLHQELVKEFRNYSAKEYHTKHYDYAIDVYNSKFIQQSNSPPPTKIKIQQDLMQIEQPSSSQWWAQNNDMSLLYAMTLEMSRQEDQVQRIQEEIVEEFEELQYLYEDTPNQQEIKLPQCQTLYVHIPDVYEGYILWILEKVQIGLQQSEPNDCQNSNLLFLVNSLFESLKQYSQLRWQAQRNYGFDLLQRIWKSLLQRLNDLDISDLTQIAQNPPPKVKILVLVLIYGTIHLKHSNDQFGEIYRASLQNIFIQVNELILSILIKLQALFKQSKGSLVIMSQRLYEQSQPQNLTKREDPDAFNKNERVRTSGNVEKGFISLKSQNIQTYVGNVKTFLKDVIRADDTQGNLVKIFEIADQVVYVWLVNLLVQVQKRYPQEQMNLIANKSAWGAFICEALLDRFTKNLANKQLKIILRNVMQQEEYWQMKDFNIYRTELNNISESLRDTSTYQNQKNIVKSLNILGKIAQKRQQIWKQFNYNDSIQIIKETMKIKNCIDQALMLLEKLI